MKNLYNYFLHFNEYTGEWNAFKREESNLYLTNMKDMKTLISDKDINEVIKQVAKPVAEKILL